MMNDELQVYRGSDYALNDKIVIHQPTLDEICSWGEQKYFSFIYNFVATPTDKKYQLHLAGQDWNTMTDYELFIYSYSVYSKDTTALVFGDLDFQKMGAYKNKDNDEIVLYDKDSDIVFDRSLYEMAVSYLRSAHKITKNVEIAMTETTKEVLLEEAKEQIEMNSDNSQKSILLPLISTLVNMKEFKYGWSDVWNMKINAFMDSVSRIQHIKNAELLLSSGYSGFGVDLKKISKDEINYFYRSNES